MSYLPGGTYQNRVTGELGIAIGPIIMSVGARSFVPDQLHEWKPAEEISFEELLLAWGVTEDEYELDIEPALQRFLEFPEIEVNDWPLDPFDWERFRRCRGV